jgi:ubiquinone/menaquinone biosynthesis C-methylase UbiE
MDSSTFVEYHGQRVDIPALMRHILTHEVSTHYSPWFFSYYGDLSELYIDRYVRFLRKLLTLRRGGVAGQRVLDAGCGFGFMALLLALMDAREVHGLDSHQGMIDTFRTYLDVLPYTLPIYPRQGSVSAMPYADESFDLVLSHEAISHYLDVDGFMREAYRVLRPGGALIISDSNNALNQHIVQMTWEIWWAFEQGPATDNLHGHKIESPFVEQRALIIGRDFPQLDPKEVASLARHTSGLWGAGLHQAVEGYLHTGDLPSHLYHEGQCPVDPVQGYYIESLFNPYALKRQLDALGFNTQVYAYLGGARGGLLAVANDVLTWHPLTPLIMPWAGSFRLIATKKAR